MVFWLISRNKELFNLVSMIPKEQSELLQDRLKKHPELRQLRKKLLSFGGKEIVPREEPDLSKIVKRGKLFKNKAKLTKLRMISCHTNAVELYATKGYKIATGWALSDDGLWRQHSWCIDSGNNIVETTKRRKKYFGFVLMQKEAKKFYHENI